MVHIGRVVSKAQKEHRTKTDPFYFSKLHKALRRLCLKRDDNQCQECKRNGIITQGRIADHIHPRNAGGKDILTNYQTMCDSCHAKKSIEDKKHYK